MKLLSYLLFAAICLAALYIPTFFLEPEEATISHEAANPDIYLSNSRTYAMEHAYDRSLIHLEKAIASIRKIEQDLDEDSREVIEESIVNLNTVYNELLHDSLSMEDMNKAFIKVLNALTYAEVKVSEHFLESHDVEKAQLALKYGRLHMKNSIRYAKGDMRNYEVHLYEEIDSLIEDSNLTNYELIDHLETVLAKLDTIDTE